MNKPTLRQQIAEMRRQQILDTAVRLFAQQGVAGTTTKRIAQDIKVAEALIFHYFPTKRDLLKAVLDSHHSYLSDLRTLLSDDQLRPPYVVLHQLAEGWLQTLRREAAFTSMLLSEAQIDPMVGEVLHNLINEGVSRLAIYLDSQRKAGVLRPQFDAPMSAHMFLSSIIVFFILNRDADTEAWKSRSSDFAKTLVETWRVSALATP